MNVEHTAGPWRIESKQLGEWPIWADSNTIHCVGAAGKEADARLMAAAPKLLEALTALLFQSGSFFDEQAKFAAQIEAGNAIKAATGKPAA